MNGLQGFFLTVGLVLLAMTAYPAQRVILDTDPSYDPDDAGCMAMLHAMASAGEIHILAVMNSTNHRESPLCISAINRFYGRRAIPVGDYRSDGKHDTPEGNYDFYIAGRYPRDLERDDDAPEAYRLYRELLAGSPDRSVTILVTGTMHNLEKLLRSSPDRFSELDGIGLVERKAARVVCMGGNFIGHSGHDRANWGGSEALCAYRSWACLDESRNALTRYVIEHCPVPFVASGWENGNGDFHGAGQGNVITGQGLKKLSASHIVRRAYEFHFENRGGAERIDRHSNDQCALLYGVRGARSYFDEYLEGRITLREDGSCEWTASPGGQQGYVAKRASDEVLADTIEGLMLALPMNPDDSPPLRPDELTVTVHDADVVLRWEAAHDPTPGSWVAHYNVYRDEERIGKAHGIRYVDTAVPPGEYAYEVAAVNVNAVESEKASVRVRAAQQPPSE